MNLLPKPEQSIPEKLLKLSLLFFAFFVLQNFVISPLLSLVFDVNSDGIAQLQGRSHELAKKAGGEALEIQSTVFLGAKEIKSQLTHGQYWFVYISQMSYNIICFLLCALIFRRFAFVKEDTMEDWQKTRFMLYAMSPALLISALPIIGESLHLNQWLGINNVLEKLGANTNQNSIGDMIFSYAVFIPENLTQLISSLFFVALIPAIGEELLFRGSLQKLWYQKSHNIHNSVFVSAFIFSLLHFEITAFFYRFFLGVLLGYSYFWSRTIVIPIIIHAFNNGLTVLYMYYSFQPNNPLESPTVDQNPSLSTLLSTLMALMILLMFYGEHRRRELVK